MKKILLILLLLFAGYASADYIEVRDAGGRSYGSYAQRHYVCYTKRIKVVVDGEMYVGYRGCTRESEPCRYLGKVHFGKYPSNRAAANALWRCKNSRPRFVD
jgi:hypothetical protein